MYSQKTPTEQKNPLLNEDIHVYYSLQNFSSVAFFPPEHILFFSSALQMFVFEKKFV